MKRPISLFYFLPVLLGFVVSAVSAQQVTLRVFSGGQNQRPDLMGQLFAQYEKSHPNVRIVIETGASTSEAQGKYLSSVLTAKDPAIDIFMVDIVGVTPYFNSGWIEPLDSYLGPAKKVLSEHLPVYGNTNVVNGKLAAMPGFADAMFMYYRKDLLAKYKIREPRTWDELSAASKKIMAGENNPALEGLSIQGAPIEGTVCTFLLPYWSQNAALVDADGRLTLDKAKAVKGLDQWLSLIDQGVVSKTVAGVKTGDTVKTFLLGNAIFAVNWGFAWDRFKEDRDSVVAGKVGVSYIPAVTGGKPVTCVGGWQWAVSAFSRHKAESADLVRYLADPASSKMLAIQGSLLPTYGPGYVDADVTRQVPWFFGAGVAVGFGKSRPANAKYSDVSEVVRSVTSDVLARKKTAQAGVDEMQTKLQPLFRQ